MRKVSIGAAVLMWAILAAQGAQAGRMPAQEVLRSWYGLVLKLVRHTPTYSPPVASRAFAYLGVTAFEAGVPGSADLKSLASQLNGLNPTPPREAGRAYDEAIVVDAAMSDAAQRFFENTGPTGQRAIAAMEAKLSHELAADIPADVAERSKAYGKAVAAHVRLWSSSDGGNVVENMGFPLQYARNSSPTLDAGRWVPTSLAQQQQKPLLPVWGGNRPFAMPRGAACDLPPPPAYSEDKSSAFYKQAMEVAEVRKTLTSEQVAIARFWSDDPMLSPTPPGHWISIALQLLDREHADLGRTADVLARVGIAEADAFIGCWHTKYEYDTLRPVTYIRKLIDPGFEPLLITPPFPEYPSGHSTQSGAAAAVLTRLFGDNFAFDDTTHTADGLPGRKFASFWAAAEEAAISRLYGGIHFRAAVERGLTQGKCIGAYTNALRTRR